MGCNAVERGDAIMRKWAWDTMGERRGFALGSALLLLSTVQLAAATPRDELLRLVPDSVGFCLVVQDLRGRAATLRNSPFLQQLSESPLGVRIRAGDEVKKLDRIETKMKEKIGLDWAQLRDDILGDALVLAYRPGPPGKPEQEQGVMLLRARNEKVLVDLIDRVNKVQKEEGELKSLEERRHNDIVYYRRLEYDKRTERDKPPTFYYVHGPILAISTQENMIQQVMECDRTGATIKRGEAARRLRELDAERALLAVWINPRAFDAEVDAKIAHSTGERATAVKHFALYWKALESVVVSLSPSDREIKLSLGVRARAEELPAAARRLFREASTASEVWQRFPESALIAVGGRLDGATLPEVIGGFLTVEQRQTLHAALNRHFYALLGEDDFASEVLPAIGPDWGLCLLAPPAADKNWMPRALFALRVESKRAKKAIEPKLLGILDFAARLLIFVHNNQQPDRPFSLKTGAVDGREVRYLSGDLPAGIQPSYALLDGHILLSSSLEEMNRFARTPPPVAPSPGAAIPLLRISFKDWRAYLKARREPIAQFLAENNHLSREEATRRIDGLLAGLQFVECIELRQRTAPGQMILNLSVQTTHALKK
jgi:hypothetical protein